jgi:hypothetical protein
MAFDRDPGEKELFMKRDASQLSTMEIIDAIALHLLFKLCHFPQITETAIQILLLLQNNKIETNHRNGGKLESERAD